MLGNVKGQSIAEKKRSRDETKKVADFSHGSPPAEFESQGLSQYLRLTSEKAEMRLVVIFLPPLPPLSLTVFNR